MLGKTRDPRRDPRYTSKRWRQVRKRVLTRDNFTCQNQLPGCAGSTPWLVVDHVRPVTGLTTDFEFYDESLLRASCKPCNMRRALTRFADAPAGRSVDPGASGEPSHTGVPAHECANAAPTAPYPRIIGDFGRNSPPAWAGPPGTCPPECSPSKIKPGGYVDRRDG
jgi:hypothetical protein